MINMCSAIELHSLGPSSCQYLEARDGKKREREKRGGKWASRLGRKGDPFSLPPLPTLPIAKADRTGSRCRSNWRLLLWGSTCLSEGQGTKHMPSTELLGLEGSALSFTATAGSSCCCLARAGHSIYSATLHINQIKIIICSLLLCTILINPDLWMKCAD